MLRNLDNDDYDDDDYNIYGNLFEDIEEDLPAPLPRNDAAISNDSRVRGHDVEASSCRRSTCYILEHVYSTANTKNDVNNKMRWNN